MRRFVLSCLTGLAFITGHATSSRAFELSQLLNTPTSTSEEAPQLLNPTATPCLDIVSGCSVITLDQNSIELLNPELNVGIDGSLTIEALGSWTNSRSMNSHRAKVVIRLPKQLRPLALPGNKAPTSSTSHSNQTATCSEQAPANGNTLSLTQLSEVLMGQKAISQTAALFTSGCDR